MFEKNDKHNNTYIKNYLNITKYHTYCSNLLLTKKDTNNNLELLIRTK